MECLQYLNGEGAQSDNKIVSFKPCYKWNAFNTVFIIDRRNRDMKVLNLVINGMPSIQ